MVVAFDSDRFEDRIDAGEQLATFLVERNVEVDIVLAIPRGGLPLGRIVADTLGVPLDIVVSSKIGAPNNPELAIGAVASDGTVWIDEDAVQFLGIAESYIEQERSKEATIARDKAAAYRTDGTVPEVTDLNVLIVDDGVATGSTATAAIRLLRERGARLVMLAIPVGPPDTIAQLEREADDVFCLRMPPAFGAVGQYYSRFDQVSDEEAISILQCGET